MLRLASSFLRLSPGRNLGHSNNVSIGVDTCLLVGASSVTVGGRQTVMVDGRVTVGAVSWQVKCHVR